MPRAHPGERKVSTLWVTDVERENGGNVITTS